MTSIAFKVLFSRDSNLTSRSEADLHMSQFQDLPWWFQWVWEHYVRKSWSKLVGHKQHLKNEIQYVCSKGNLDLWDFCAGYVGVSVWIGVFTRLLYKTCFWLWNMLIGTGLLLTLNEWSFYKIIFLSIRAFLWNYIGFQCIEVRNPDSEAKLSLNPISATNWPYDCRQIPQSLWPQILQLQSRENNNCCLIRLLWE